MYRRLRLKAASYLPEHHRRSMPPGRSGCDRIDGGRVKFTAGHLRRDTDGLADLDPTADVVTEDVATVDLHEMPPGLGMEYGSLVTRMVPDHDGPDRAD